MTQAISNKFIVAYGYNDKFELTQDQAVAIVKARENGADIVKFNDMILSTKFTWLVPKNQTREIDLTGKELLFAEQIAEWLSRDIHNLDFNYDSALKYTKRLVNKNYSAVFDLWKQYADGAYPSVRKFLLYAKEILGEKENQLYLE